MLLRRYSMSAKISMFCSEYGSTHADSASSSPWLVNSDMTEKKKLSSDTSSVHFPCKMES